MSYIGSSSLPAKEPRLDEWGLVIKVKYGETLRRFGAHVHGGSMNLSMSSVRAKIINLFKFSPDAVLVLTYTDEDGDSVALDEDEELHDAAISQRLNPLRIYVQLKGPESSDPKPQTASSTPTLSHPIHTMPLQINSAVSEALRSIPDPLRGAISKISHDLALKAASSPLADLLDHFSNLGLSNAGLPSHSSTNSTNVNAVDEPKDAIDPVPETVASPVDLNVDPPRIQHASEPFSINDSSRHTLTPHLREDLGKGVGDAKSTSATPSAPSSSQQPTVLVTRMPSRRPNVSHPTCFHRGVQCDGCGMYPITGPRFKSNVKENYDLCSVCFSEMGTEADYTRIERALHHSAMLTKELFIPPGYRMMRQFGTKPESPPPRAKLESLFIKDVTVVDGTVMPPCTPFTKIWRMRNNGTIAWPSGTLLTWVGGNPLQSQGTTNSVIISGCPVGEEIDFAVDFMSPFKPGSYISYWRLATASFRAFGQRVWVQIEVENTSSHSPSGGVPRDLNLNLPPESSDHHDLGLIDMNVDPSEVELELEPLTNSGSSTMVGPVTADSLFGAQEMDFLESTPVAHTAVSEEAVVDDNSVEKTLLRELEEMGFKQIDLNKEVLKQNDYDLEQSVDDLCGFVEWDPLLAELQEMGFHDEELNKKLLVKNGGSIKRVVLDLISG